EDDGLALSGARKNVASVQDEQMIAPDYIAFRVHNANPVGISVKRDAQFCTILAHGSDQVFQVLDDRRVRMMVGKGAVAFAEQPASVQLQPFKELRRNQGTRSVTAVENHLHRSRNRACSLENVLQV